MSFHQKPPICLQEYVDNFFNPIFTSAKNMNITLVLVFDGHSHPHKENTS